MIRSAALGAIATFLVAAAPSLAAELTPAAERVVSRVVDANVIDLYCDLGLASDGERLGFAARAAGQTNDWSTELYAKTGGGDEFRRLYEEARSVDPAGRAEAQLEREFVDLGRERACAAALDRLVAAGLFDTFLVPAEPHPKTSMGLAAAECERAVRYLLAEPDRYRRDRGPIFSDKSDAEWLGLPVGGRSVRLSFLAAAAGDLLLSTHDAECAFVWPIDDRPRLPDGELATDEETADHLAGKRSAPHIVYPSPMLSALVVDGAPVDEAVLTAIRLSDDRRF